MNFNADLSCPLSCLFETAPRPPINFLKEPAMQFLKADQIVTAVSCWSNYGSVAGFCQFVRCFDETCRWNRRAVRVDQTNRLESHLEQILGCEQQSLSK